MEHDISSTLEDLSSPTRVVDGESRDDLYVYLELMARRLVSQDI
jgi:hypothetical protein